MNTYKITIETNEPEYNGETTERWYGYTEQVAIAQAMLSHAQNGALALKVTAIEQV